MDMKVLRDAGACHFDIPLVFDLSWTQVEDRLPPGSHVFLADSLSSSANPDEPSVVEYTAPSFAKCSHVALVVGGETKGLSRSACQLCTSSQWNARRIHIPMAVGVNSLNSAVSASVILYEIWRQMMSVTDTELHQLNWIMLIVYPYTDVPSWCWLLHWNLLLPKLTCDTRFPRWHNLTLPEAVDMAQNRPLWRLLMSGDTQS